MRRLFSFVLFCMPLTAAFADDLPWAATQKLEDITGLTLPADWAERAPWQTSFTVSDEDLPRFYDWRFYALGLTPVKRQRAGDCWAQGTVGVLESLIKIEFGIETDMSVQEVISCSRSGTARNGGMFAHEYHRKNGAVSNTAFPYKASDIPCKKGLKPEYQLEKWGYVGVKKTRPSVIQMKQALMEHGPIGVTIVANSALKRFKGDGVFTGCSNSSTGLNHIEVIVGWDDDEAGGVWFVRNSWGPTHGKEGYAKMKYGCSNVGYISTWADLKVQ